MNNKTVLNKDICCPDYVCTGSGCKRPCKRHDSIFTGSVPGFVFTHSWHPFRSYQCLENKMNHVFPYRQDLNWKRMSPFALNAVGYIVSINRTGFGPLCSGLGIRRRGVHQLNSNTPHHSVVSLTSTIPPNLLRAVRVIELQPYTQSLRRTGEGT